MLRVLTAIFESLMNPQLRGLLSLLYPGVGCAKHSAVGNIIRPSSATRIDSLDMPRATRRDTRDRSGRFNVTGKAFFLTYPQAHGATLESLYNFFNDYWTHAASGTKCQDTLVAQEAHEDGSPHFHVFIRFNARINILDQRAFDYKEGNTTFHPNIQTCRSPKHVIKYCVKEGQFKANFTVTIKKSVKQVLQECSSTAEFISGALEEQGWQNARAYNSLKRLGDDFYAAKNDSAKVCDPIFDIATFVNVPDPIKEFIHDISERQPGGRDRVKSLWLWGDTRLGKTALAQSLGKHTRITNVWNFECLDRTGKAQYLILDDISWESWKYQFRTLLGCQRDVSFSGKYQKPTSFVFAIPAIVLSNDLPFFTHDESRWLNGNVTFVQIIDPLYLPDSL